MWRLPGGLAQSVGLRCRQMLGLVGLSLCVVLLIAWLCTLYCSILYGSSPTMVWLGGGGVEAFIVYEKDVYADFPSGLQVHPPSEIKWLCDYSPLHSNPRVLAYYFHLPLWIPFCLLAFALSFAKWRGHRAKQGHCRKCRYNLMGNTSGVCPECGTPITDEQQKMIVQHRI